MRWAALIPKDQRSAILNQKHSDWPKLLRWVPRSWTSWLGDPPRKLWGNAPNIICPHYQIEYPGGGGCDEQYPKPIPDPGQWWVGVPLYAAVQTKRRWYCRIGFRWDDNDWYYALSFTIKRYRS
jgi:hypothetical protein